jgi:hypothetical protein
MYGQKKAMIKGKASTTPATKKAVSPAKPSANMAKMNKSTSPAKKAAVKGNLKRIGAGDPNYVKDMIKRGKSKPKPGMMK